MSVFDRSLIEAGRKIAGTDWSGSTSHRLELQYMRFIRVNLCECDWDGIQALGTSFESCNFDRARLRNSEFNDWCSTFVESDPLLECPDIECDDGEDRFDYFAYEDLTGPDDGLYIFSWSRTGGFSECTFEDADISESRLLVPLYDVNFRSANLSKSVFAGRMFAVDFSDSNLVGASFSFELEHCNFFNANLTDSDFRGATLESVSFRNANLDGVNLDQCRLIDVDFAGVDMTRVDLSRVVY
jgi:uncharacterized protein YjbI with pentapeptide repeats